MSMDDQKYLLDGMPISARGLIAEAALLDDKFDADWMKSTSRAAGILRSWGYSVEEKTDAARAD